MLTLVAAAIVLQPANTLTAAEIRDGWKLLFDGKTTKGWHNFKSNTVGSGWTIQDGVLTSTNPETARDIMTYEKFDWFELSLDFNVGKGQNSGVLFRCTEEGEAIWHSGPEVQIYDYTGPDEVERTGYLYQLYHSKQNAATSAGQWSNMRIVVAKRNPWGSSDPFAPTRCATYINGVKYYEYDIDSADFWARVKKSKFNEFPQFAKTKKGSIGIQGDHGTVSFRNIKIRPLK